MKTNDLQRKTRRIRPESLLAWQTWVRKMTDANIRKISSSLSSRGTMLLSLRALIGYLALNEVPTALNQVFIAMICQERLPALFVLS